MGDMCGWMVAQVSKGDVLEACEKLRDLGLEVYCPMAPISVRRANQRRPVTVMQPAYFNWVFLRGVVSYYKLDHTAGLHVKMMFWGEEVLSDDIISGVRHQESLWTATTMRKPPPKDRKLMSPGDMVVVGAGVFCGGRFAVVEDRGDSVKVNTESIFGEVFISAFLLDFPEA